MEVNQLKLHPLIHLWLVPHKQDQNHLHFLETHNQAQVAHLEEVDNLQLDFSERNQKILHQESAFLEVLQNHKIIHQEQMLHKIRPQLEVSLASKKVPHLAGAYLVVLQSLKGEVCLVKIHLLDLVADYLDRRQPLLFLEIMDNLKDRYSRVKQICLVQNQRTYPRAKMMTVTMVQVKVEIVHQLLLRTSKHLL